MNANSVRGKSDRLFKLVVYTILIFCAACAILPFLLLIISSFTSEESLAVYGYSFWPREWSLYSYKWLFSTNGARVFRAYGVTIFITVVGTGLSLLIAPLLAYPLSRRDYKRRNFFTFVVFFTMLFNGGLVPSYIMWTQTFHIKNTIAALLFPNLMMGAFYVIMMRTYFTTNIPEAVIEAARIDGAGRWKQTIHVTTRRSPSKIKTSRCPPQASRWPWLSWARCRFSSSIRSSRSIS